MIESRQITAGWSLASQDILYALVHDQKLLWLDGAGNGIGVIRIFTSKEEAEWYLLKVEQKVTDALAVQAVTLEALYQSAPAIDQHLKRSSKARLRIHLCVLRAPSAAPQTVDVLWEPVERHN